MLFVISHIVVNLADCLGLQYLGVVDPEVLQIFQGPLLPTVNEY